MTQKTKTTPPQSEERWKIHPFNEDMGRFQQEINSEPSHPDTLRERVEKTLKTSPMTGELYEGETVESILSLIAQEKERWESESEKKLDDTIMSAEKIFECYIPREAREFITKSISNQRKE